MTPFGVYVRYLRAVKGITLKALAREVKVSSAYLSALEHGSKGRPNKDLVRSLGAYFMLSHQEQLDLEYFASVSSTTVSIPKNSDPRMYHLIHILIHHFAQRGDERLARIHQYILTQGEGATPALAGLPGKLLQRGGAPC